MAKVAIKNENITSFGGIYHVMDVFPKFVQVQHGRETECPVSAHDMAHGTYKGRKSYSLVVQRSPLKDKDGNVQSDMFGPLYAYRCILTNDRLSTEKDIIIFSELRYKKN